MPRSEPHPHTLFSLVPSNDRARDVLTHSNNRHLVSSLPDHPGGPTQGLNIGFQIGSKSCYTLATIGRYGTDVVIEGSNISRIQCSFELQQATGFIMLYDRSTCQTTQVYGDNATPFELGRCPRRVLLWNKLNTYLGIGGATYDLFQFEIYWNRDAFEVEAQISTREDNPLFAVTDHETPTLIRQTRIQINNQDLKIRYICLDDLGCGQFGEVKKAVNVDSGKVMAVKRIKRPEPKCHTDAWPMINWEVEALTHISHPNIIEFISAQEGVDKRIEIFMELKQGNLDGLIGQHLFENDWGAATQLLRHMLQALDYLAYMGIIHRDVKPANILYTSSLTNGYSFQLTDFGLCHPITNDKLSCVGSPPFMAPELLTNREVRQTSKVDVWSLFVTLAYAMNAGRYREKPLHTINSKIRAVLEAAAEPVFHGIKDMAIVDPERRASAAQMLDRVFSGEGRTTPRNEISNNNLLTYNPYLR